MGDTSKGRHTLGRAVQDISHFLGYVLCLHGLGMYASCKYQIPNTTFQTPNTTSQMPNISSKIPNIPNTISEITITPSQIPNFLDMSSIFMISACKHQTPFLMQNNSVDKKSQARLPHCARDAMGPLDSTLAGLSSPGWAGQISSLRLWYYNSKSSCSL